MPPGFCHPVLREAQILTDLSFASINQVLSQPFADFAFEGEACDGTLETSRNCRGNICPGFHRGLALWGEYGGHGRVISGSAALCPSLFGGHVPCGYIDRPLADGDVSLRYRAAT
jgi:hypothetical protein